MIHVAHRVVPRRVSGTGADPARVASEVHLMSQPSNPPKELRRLSDKDIALRA